MIEVVIKTLMVQYYLIIMVYIRNRIIHVKLQIFCDRMSLRLKNRFYKAVVKPIILVYGCWAEPDRTEGEIAEMMTFR